MRPLALSVIVILLSTALPAQEPAWEWVMHAGGSNYDNAYTAAADTGGNFFVAGGFRGASLSFGSTVVYNTSANQDDGFVVKLNSDGEALWARHIGGNLSDGIVGLTTDMAGNSYVCGVFGSATMQVCDTMLINASSDLDAFLVKYDPDGSCLWARQAGGQYHDGIEQAAVDAEGNVYVLGNYEISPLTIGDTVLPQPYVSSQDIFFAKYDDEGTFQWARRIGGSMGDDAYYIACDGAGGVYIAGRYSGLQFFIGSDTLHNPGNPYSYDGYLAKYDGDGNELWARRIGSTDNDIIFGLAADPDGTTYIVGSFTDDELMLDTLILPNSGEVDGFVAKFDPGGGIVWVVPVEGPDYEAVNAVAADGYGGCLVTGVFRSATSILGDLEMVDPDPGQYDLFIAWLDEHGDPVWRKTAHGNGDDLPLGIAFSGHAGLLIAGNFYGDSLQIGTSLMTNSAPPVPDIFIAALKDLDDIGIGDNTVDGLPWMHYPDPATDRLDIFGLVPEQVRSIVAVDVAGRACPLRYSRGPRGIEMDVQMLGNGVHVLLVRTDQGVCPIRFSVQH